MGEWVIYKVGRAVVVGVREARARLLVYTCHALSSHLKERALTR